MKRCVVVGGADITEYGRIKKYFADDDYFIYCDSGLRHEEKLGKAPDLIVGDFDSHEKPDTKVETIVLPREKDETDTLFAINEAVRRGYENFLLVGMTGKRMDHTIGNISILLKLFSMNKQALLLDDYSEMEIVGSETKYVEDTYPYFSLLNVSGTARGIDVVNAKYPVSGGTIECDFQYGISNEVLPGKKAEIKVKDGMLLLIKVIRE